MKLYAPHYYENFKCKAGRCRHSCCIGWEIGVDEATLCRCDSLQKNEREDIFSHIEDGIIKLDNDKRCPFLDAGGLCKIISAHGEEYISEICREHPRFYNFLPGRAEVGLGASCEEAAMIILSSDEYDSFFHIGEIEAEPMAEESSVIHERAFIYSVLKNSLYSYKEKLSVIFDRYKISSELFLPERLGELFSELEYLREEDREGFSRLQVCKGGRNAKYSERFFAYLVYRHFTCSESYGNLRAKLCMCFALLKLFESLCEVGTEPCEAARLISEEIEYSEDNIDNLILTFE